MSLINDTKLYIHDLLNLPSMRVKDGENTVASFLKLFNPLAMPLLSWSRIVQVSSSFYFVNDSFIQFKINTQVDNSIDIGLEENNILLLSNNVAFSLDAFGGSIAVPGIENVFLELD